MTTAKINNYIAARLALGRSPATCNRETTLLKAVLRFGMRQTPVMITTLPAFPTRLKESPPRAGFITNREYAVLAANADSLWLRALLAICYSFGLRKGEALSLRVSNIDLLSRMLILEPHQTKTGQARKVALTQETFELLRALMAGKQANDRLFAINDPRKSWARLCARAGLPGLLIHDLRRSAVRNLVRAGVSETIAMRISGHRTRSTFDRYNIVSEGDLIRASRLIEAGRQASEPGAGTDTKTDTSTSAGS